jgi:hypothetical protein
MLSRGCDEFDRSDGIGHDYCCGDLDVIRVFTDSAGDGLLECCVRFQVDQEEADVCLKLLFKDCNGTFALGCAVCSCGGPLVSRMQVWKEFSRF